MVETMTWRLYPLEKLFTSTDVWPIAIDKGHAQ